MKRLLLTLAALALTAVACTSSSSPQVEPADRVEQVLSGEGTPAFVSGCENSSSAFCVSVWVDENFSFNGVSSPNSTASITTDGSRVASVNNAIGDRKMLLVENHDVTETLTLRFKHPESGRSVTQTFFGVSDEYSTLDSDRQSDVTTILNEISADTSLPSWLRTTASKVLSEEYAISYSFSSEPRASVSGTNITISTTAPFVHLLDLKLTVMHELIHIADHAGTIDSWLGVDKATAYANAKRDAQASGDFIMTSNDNVAEEAFTEAVLSYLETTTNFWSKHSQGTILMPYGFFNPNAGAALGL